MDGGEKNSQKKGVEVEEEEGVQVNIVQKRNKETWIGSGVGGRRGGGGGGICS